MMLRLTLLLVLLCGLGSEATGLNINTTNFNLYTSTVNAPYSIYSWVLTGNTALENFYNKFNTTGILGAGALLLLASGYFALKSLPPPYVVRQQIRDFQKDPLSILPEIPKPILPISNGNSPSSSYGAPSQSYGAPSYNAPSSSYGHAKQDNDVFSHEISDDDRLANVFGKPSVTFSYDLHGFEDDPFDDSGGGGGGGGRSKFYYKTTPKPRRESSYYVGGSNDSPRGFSSKFQVSGVPGPPYDLNRSGNSASASDRPRKGRKRRIYMNGKGSLMDTIRDVFSDTRLNNVEPDYHDYYLDLDEDSHGDDSKSYPDYSKAPKTFSHRYARKKLRRRKKKEFRGGGKAGKDGGGEKAKKSATPEGSKSPPRLPGAEPVYKYYKKRK